ncbi:MAG TPA: AMP-binding protein, partial [Terriglobia bacterium]|nr:AMP-binding protein [Terriglobia bacterium]
MRKGKASFAERVISGGALRTFNGNSSDGTVALHMTSYASRLPLIARALQHGGRTAVVDTQGSFTYNDLLNASSRVATALLAGRPTLQEERVAYSIAPGFPWVAVQWGIWRAGGVAVPLPSDSTRPELDYIIDDAGAARLVFDAEVESRIAPLAAARNVRAEPFEKLLACKPRELPDVSIDQRAMILYTSGTTSRPKGVVTTHSNIAAQIVSLVEAWEWSADDRILLCLPLHHVHGIINVVSCALWSGATCEMLPRF